jgi:hypothetical protein
MSPINNGAFDYELQDFLNCLVRSDDVFDQISKAIQRPPMRS